MQSDVLLIYLGGYHAEAPRVNCAPELGLRRVDHAGTCLWCGGASIERYGEVSEDLPH